MFYFWNPSCFNLYCNISKEKKKEINDKCITSEDWFTVAFGQHRKKRWLSCFKYCIGFGFCLAWRVIFDLFQLCKMFTCSHTATKMYPTHSVRVNSATSLCLMIVPLHFLQRIFKCFRRLIYPRKHPDSLFKATWYVSTIGSKSPSFIVCWIVTKLVLRSHKYARMARGLVPPPQHSCL